MKCYRSPFIINNFHIVQFTKLFNEFVILDIVQFSITSVSLPRSDVSIYAITYFLSHFLFNITTAIRADDCLFIGQYLEYLTAPVTQNFFHLFIGIPFSVDPHSGHGNTSPFNFPSITSPARTASPGINE